MTCSKQHIIVSSKCVLLVNATAAIPAAKEADVVPVLVSRLALDKQPACVALPVHYAEAHFIYAPLL
jgi:hypothetical protein